MTYEKIKVKEPHLMAPDIRPLWLFMIISPFFYGGFYEWVSCLFSIFLTGYLLYCYWKTGTLYIHINLTVFAPAVLVIFYGISGIWAVDRGMAIMGFCKFLPLVLFVLAVMQVKPEAREKLLDAIPLSGAVMTVLSFLLGQISFLQGIFFVNRRLAGFFQYPNTFAVFLLVGSIILIGKEQWKVSQILCLIILLSGIVLTGSRTVFLILGVVGIGFCFVLRGKKRWLLCLLLTTLMMVSALYAVLTGNMSTVGRYLTVSFGSSTFLGRLLYFKDALPIILKHPLGLGYMGYYYTQGAFQTGVYSVLNIHNELLQILLDVGWIPAVVCVMAVIRSFAGRRGNLTGRMLILALLAHCMFDFDLQFISVGFALVLVMDLESGSVLPCRSSVLIRTVGIFFAGLCIWLGTVSGLYYFGRYEDAVKLYPGCTSAWISMLSQVERADTMESVADEILKWNQSVSLAYSAKARSAYAEGDFKNVIFFKRKAIALSKYELEEYLDYFDMLYIGIQLYLENGDSYSAEYCRQQLMEIPNMIEMVLEETDELAWKINDQPELVLPDDYQEILKSLSF